MSAAVDVVDEASVPSWSQTFDVVVAGLGCAGAAAAIDAARAGASVAAIERASGPGGTSSMSGGVIYLGGGTELQRACGFEDSVEDMAAYLMASCGPAPDAARIERYAADSVAHYNWFVELGVPFKAEFYPHYSGEPPNDDGLVFSGSENAHPYRDLARPAPRGHVPQVPGQAGGLLMRHLGAHAERAATALCDARVTALVRGSDGSIVGVRVGTTDGDRFLRARGGVVLATGGFINNEDMVETYTPELRRCMFRVGAEGDDGSGMRLGAAAGGALINMHMGSISLPIIPPKSMQRGLLINAQGQRFINEDAYYGVLGEHVLLRQGGVAYLVLDEATFERPDVPREIAGVGESAAELESALGLPPGSFEATVNLYNRHAADGVDPLFGKAAEWIQPLQPPFGALDCRVDSSLFAAFTLGGLRTDVDGRVVSMDGEVLPGLYAAGRASACLASPGYSSGLSIGDGTFFGRRAGRHAAERSQ